MADRIKQQNIANWLQEVLGSDYIVRYDDCESGLTRVIYKPLNRLVKEVANAEMKSGISVGDYEASRNDKAEARAKGLI